MKLEHDGVSAVISLWYACSRFFFACLLSSFSMWILFFPLDGLVLILFFIKVLLLTMALSNHDFVTWADGSAFLRAAAKWHRQYSFFLSSPAFLLKPTLLCKLYVVLAAPRCLPILRQASFCSC